MFSKRYIEIQGWEKNEAITNPKCSWKHLLQMSLVFVFLYFILLGMQIASEQCDCKSQYADKAIPSCQMLGIVRKHNRYFVYLEWF